jgi:D-beta-D-heptose 7-phosphate kinase/D-beta-D-heptose 1-phosphate adenosyltransferase
MKQAAINVEVLAFPAHPTTSKLRILGGKQQILRLDTEKTDPYPPEAYAALLSKVDVVIADADAVILSDYAKGVLSEEVCQGLIDKARKRDIPIFVDPKRSSFARYRGATTICPNLLELSVATDVSASNLDDIFAAASSMLSELDLQYLVPTLGEKGIAVVRKSSTFVAPAQARQVFDVSGAGDTVIATLALASAGGLQIEVAVQLANVAAGIAVGKVGTVPVYRDELLNGLMPELDLQVEEKVLTLDSLRVRASGWRLAGQKIVFTNGCFDLLHIGHVTLLENARREGNRLVVAINSDKSARELKGPSRPIVGEHERGRIIAALSAVDAVIVFDAPTPLRVIEALRPDVLVKGGDYSQDTIVGAKEVLSWGGQVKIVPTVEGFSTTNLITKALERADGDESE